MKIFEIETYLNILSEQLCSFDANEQDVSEIIDSIRIRMMSILKNWNDEGFRKGILIVGLEEAIFYRPQINDFDKKAFVVVAVRNSLLENLSDVKYNSSKIMLEDSQIKEVTGSALTYFNDIDFSDLSSKIQSELELDFYKSIVGKYPVAWKALCVLGGEHKKIKKYEPIVSNAFSLPINFYPQNTGNDRIKHVVYNGISPDIDRELSYMLNEVANGKRQVFYSDSFKMITRNFEKLLQVMEFVLSRNKILCFANHLVTNGYIESRDLFLRPAHTHKDFELNLTRYKGLQRQHRIVLESFSNG